MNQFERVYKIDRSSAAVYTPPGERSMDDWFCASQWLLDQHTGRVAGGAVLPRVFDSPDQEILMDILRHGADFEVLVPEALPPTRCGNAAYRRRAVLADQADSVSCPSLSLPPARGGWVICA